MSPSPWCGIARARLDTAAVWECHFKFQGLSLLVQSDSKRSVCQLKNHFQLCRKDTWNSNSLHTWPSVNPGAGFYHSHGKTVWFVFIVKREGNTVLWWIHTHTKKYLHLVSMCSQHSSAAHSPLWQDVRDIWPVTDHAKNLGIFKTTITSRGGHC